MAKDNIAYHSIRLNLQNEQHLRIHGILKDLNTGIHKSLNQFVVNAIDSHISSFEDDSLTNEGMERKKGDSGFITREDLEEMRKDMFDRLKDEIIRLLVGAFAGGTMLHSPAIKQEANEGKEEEKEEENGTMASLVDKWG